MSTTDPLELSREDLFAELNHCLAEFADLNRQMLATAEVLRVRVGEAQEHIAEMLRILDEDLVVSTDA
jgi:hypothetical protein